MVYATKYDMLYDTVCVTVYFLIYPYDTDGIPI